VIVKKMAVVLSGLWLMLLSSGAGGQTTSGQVVAQVPGAPAGASVIAQTDFGRVPLYFIPNEGQIDGQVAFYIQGRDKSVYFTPGGVTLSLSQPAAAAAKARGQARAEEPPVKKDFTPRSWVVKLDFIGADAGVKPVGEEKTGGVVSYFKGKPADWKAGLPAYSRIVYRDLWPGIDLAYSGTSNRLKYEFIVHPGADPSRIRLAYRGVDGIAVDQEGRLDVRTPGNGFKDDVPVAYQEIAGVRKTVSLGYKLDVRNQAEGEAPQEKGPAGGAHAYGFEVGDYDPTQPLILDPVLTIYAGFIGGNGTEEGRCIALDASGSAYVTGFTQSSETTFPETVGPDLTANGSEDAFVAKINASGTALVYCGYLGGANDDQGRGIAVDGSGNAYVAGYTLSTQATFPVVAGADMTYNGLYDTFAAKVNAAGDALVYCTYIGGSADDYGTGIAVDMSGNAYISGYTGSTAATFCEVVGPDLIYNGGAKDGFVAKLNSAGTGLLYCGYIGGSSNDYVYGIAVDGSDNAHVVGSTSSSEASFPETVGPDLTFNGSTDVFAAKVNSGGTSLVYCGYIGGNGDEEGFGIAVDSRGCAYLTGYAAAGNLPAVVGPDLTFNDYYDAFVAKVKADGTGLDYCGYIGGKNQDYGFDIAVDPMGNAYVSGYTESDPASGFPVSEGPELILDGLSDGFIAKVNTTGSKLAYCGYFGAVGYDYAFGIAADAGGNAYVTGAVNSGSNFPAVAGPDLSHNGGTDAFVAKIYHYFAPGPKTTAIGDFDGDGTKELAVDLGTNGAWIYDGGAWTQLSAMNPEGMIPANVDADPADELLIEFGYAGLWLFNNGAMNLMSVENVETMAASDLDNDLVDEAAVDFGTTGFWLFDEGAWTQLSGANLDSMAMVNLDGYGGDEIVADFGTIGLWEYVSGSWTQLSGVNVENMAGPDIEGAGGHELVGDFGPVGLWLFMGGDWTALSTVNADYMMAADVDHSGTDELIGDFSGIGLWLYDHDGTWTILSGLDAEWEVAADTEGDIAKELAVDFGPLGIWLWDTGAWAQISGVDPENLTAGDLDGDNSEEIVADFGTLGLWLWNGGVWSQISAINPD
jgi:hypothetical protein